MTIHAVPYGAKAYPTIVDFLAGREDIPHIPPGGLILKGEADPNIYLCEIAATIKRRGYVGSDAINYLRIKIGHHRDNDIYGFVADLAIMARLVIWCDEIGGAQ